MKSLKFLSIFYAILLTSCGSNEKDAALKTTGFHSEDSIIVLSESEKDTISFTTTRIREKYVQDTLIAEGQIKTLPQQTYQITPPVKGFIQELYYKSGEKVEKGEPIAVLSGPAYLKIQEEYLVTKYDYKARRQDYTRMGELTIEKAASLKKMQQAKVKFEIYEAKLKSLEKQLELLGIEKENLEAGNLTSQITLHSPVSGIITKTRLNIGNLANESNYIYEIINLKNLVLEITIPEKQIHSLEKRQQLTYVIDGNKRYQGKIYYINKTISDPSESFKAYSKLTGNLTDQYPGIHVKTLIPKDSLKKDILDSKSIVKINKQNYIFIKHSKGYKPIKIQVERSLGKFVLVKNSEKFADEEIILDGADYLSRKY